jgi:hypothetical protein
MSLGAGLIKAGGPSPYKNNFGAVGDAIQGGLDSYNKAVSARLQQKYLAGQITKEQFGTFQQALALRQQYLGQGVAEPKQVTDILGPMPSTGGAPAQAGPTPSPAAPPTGAAPAAPTGAPPVLQGMLSANPGAPIVPPAGVPVASPPGQNVFADNEKILPLSSAAPAAPTPEPGLLSPPGPTFNQRFVSATQGAPVGLLGAGGGPSPMGPPAPAPQGPQLNGGSFGAPPAVRTQAITPPPTGAPPIASPTGPGPAPATPPGQPGVNPAFANLTPQQHAILLGGGPNAALLMKSLEPTPEMLNAKASGMASPLDYENSKVTGAANAKAYSLLHTGLAGGAMVSANNAPFLSGLTSIMKDPKFYSGTASDQVLAVRRMFAATGLGDPNGAAPMEAFNKLASGMLLQQTNALRTEGEELGVQGGRIFSQQLPIMQKANLSLDNSPAGNAYVARFLAWNGDRMQKMGDMADDYATAHGGTLDAGFEKNLRGWMAANPPPKELIDGPSGSADAGKPTHFGTGADGVRRGLINGQLVPVDQSGNPLPVVGASR